jgi:hypothetical protein
MGKRETRLSVLVSSADRQDNLGGQREPQIGFTGVTSLISCDASGSWRQGRGLRRHDPHLSREVILNLVETCPIRPLVVRPENPWVRWGAGR